MENESVQGIPDWLMSMLVCPVDKGQKLHPVLKERLTGLNRRIEAQGVKDRGGKPVEQPVQEGLLREDGKVLYVVRDGIPDLIPEDGIDVEGGDVQ